MISKIYPHGILIHAEDMGFYTPSLLEETTTLADDGFDDVTRKYAIYSTTHLNARAAAQYFFPRGKRLEELNLWVRTATGREVGAGLYEIQVKAAGLVGATRYNRKVDAQSSQGGASNVDLTVPGGYPFTYPSTVAKLRSNEASLVCRTTYVTTTAPDYTKVSLTTGYAGNPLPIGYPELPTGPANFWSYLATPIYLFPAGWVLEMRGVDAIKNDAGVEVCWAVSDTHVYYHHVKPGD